MRKHCKRIKRRLVAPTIVALHLNPEVSLHERAAVLALRGGLFIDAEAALSRAREAYRMTAQ